MIVIVEDTAWLHSQFLNNLIIFLQLCKLVLIIGRNNHNSTGSMFPISCAWILDFENCFSSTLLFNNFGWVPLDTTPPVAYCVVVFESEKPA